jgi:GMP synthase-like glutamine amidotransferase
MSAKTIFDSLWPDEFHAFHWHGDTFDIPHGAIHFAETAACKNQGFVYQDKIYGFQFHLESTQESIEQLITHCGDELDKEKYIQNADDIRNNTSCVSISNQRMHVFLNKLLDH